MTIVEAVLNETRHQTLRALCDTFVPSLTTETHDELERDFMARAASDVGVAEQIEGVMAESMTAAEIAEVAGLMDALGAVGFADADLHTRTQTVHGFAAQDAGAKQGLRALKGLTLLFFYGLPGTSTTSRTATVS